MIRIKPSHKGLLHKKLGVPQGQKIPQSKIKAAEHSASPALRKEADFADTAEHKFTHSRSSMSKSPEKRSHHSSTEGLHERGHHENQGKGDFSHKEFEQLDHGGKHDHMRGRPKECGRARLGFLAALLTLAIGVAFGAGQAPYGVFGGAGTFAQLPGNIPLVFTAAPSGASATLTTNWTGATGSYTVVFSDFESRSVTLTNAATTATWTGNLTGSPTATATVDGYTTPPGAPTYAFTSDLGVVWSNGSAWYATDNSTGISATISSGCATVSAVKGTATAFQFATTATTCTPVIQLPPAPNGWACFAQDVTHNVVFTQTASATYSCTVTGTTTSGDTVQVSAQPY